MAMILCTDSVNDASGNAVEAYTYNETGDRTSKTGPGLATGAYTYLAGTHRLTSVGTSSRTYDASGNTTGNAAAGQGWGYGYNGRNRMTVVQQNGTTVSSYVYNANGERVLKTAGPVSTRFVYGEGSQLVAEISGNGEREYFAVRGMPLAVADGAALGFITADGLDVPRMVTSSVGVVLWIWPFASHPFGETEPVAATGDVLNMRFPGQYFDAESGLNYNVHRDYEPATGRYLQSDPIGLAGGMNTFSYALANPTNQSDLLGLVTGVTVWQPVGWGESSFGHISTDINGTTYSFGPKGMTVLPTSEYLSKNSFRDGTEVTLNLSPEQEEILRTSILKSQGDYSPLKNNCGSPVQRGLKSLGIDTGNQTLPVSIGNQLLDMGVSNGVIHHAPSNPSNGVNAPWAR